MGQKSKADVHGLKEIIIKHYDSGKKTIAYVTEKTNEDLQKQGLKLTISREAIRRAVRSYDDEIADVRKGVEISKQMAEVFKDHPGTEMSEAMLMFMAQLVTKDLHNIESINFENPAEMINATTKLTMAQAKLSQYRTQAVKALDRAKEKIKLELQNAIRNDPELLERLHKIVDAAKVA